MPSSYTSNLGMELPADGEQDGVWGDVVNDNSNILDRAINGSLSLSLSGTSSTLTTSDGVLSDGQYKLLVLGGSPSGTHTITIAPNDAQKIYLVRNTTAQSVVFTQGSGGNVTIATGDSGIIYANGGGSGAAIVNFTDDLAMSSTNITGGSATGLTTLGVDNINVDGNTISSTNTNGDITLDPNGAGNVVVASGNLGIGTASPSYKLDVYGSGSQTVAVRAATSGDARFYTECAGTNSGWMQYTRSLEALQFSANGSTQHLTLNSSGNLGIAATPTNNTLGKTLQVGQAGAWVAETGSNRWWLGSNWFYDGADKYINNGHATLYSQQNGTHAWFNAASGTAGNAISFSQAMTLDASGNLLVGTTTNPDAGRFYVQAGTGYAAVLRGMANGVCQLTRAINNNTTEIALGVYSEAIPNWVTYIYSNGNIVNRNNSYGALSDAKLKENIVDSGSQWDDIKAIRVRKYSMKDEGLAAPNMLGVIAQELEAAGMGGLVFESPDLGPDNQPTGETIKQVNYSVLYMKAVKALQEAMARIEALEARLAAANL